MTDNNVTDIKSKRKKIGKKAGKSPSDGEEKPPKLSLGIVEEFLTRYFSEGQTQLFMPKDLAYRRFPVWFHKSDSLSATRMAILDETTGLAQEIDFETLTRLLHNDLSRFAIEDHPCQAYCLTHNGVRSLAKRLQACGRQLKNWPEPCGFKHQEGFFFERLNFDPEAAAEPKDFPFIQEMLSRMTNSKAFCQRIGSMFDPKADRKQAVILYGPGDGGKTTIFNMLKSLVGERGYAPITEGISSDSFGLWTLIDKRLWIGEEIKPEFFRTNTFKRLTGGAPLLINPKGEKQFSAQLRGMLFANSNEAPAIPGDSGLLNRLILCRVDPIPKSDRLGEEEVDDLLQRELPFFVGYCMELYTGGRIEPEDGSELESAVEDYESPFQVVFDAYFEEDLTAVGKDARVMTSDVTHIWELIQREFPGLTRKLNLLQFKTFISRKTKRDGLPFSIQAKRDGKKVRLVPGLRVKKRDGYQGGTNP